MVGGKRRGKRLIQKQSCLPGACSNAGATERVDLPPELVVTTLVCVVGEDGWTVHRGDPLLELLGVLIGGYAPERRANPPRVKMLSVLVEVQSALV
jgi:hypothetical protein